jgi:hypothetical protein
MEEHSTPDPGALVVNKSENQTLMSARAWEARVGVLSVCVSTITDSHCSVFGLEERILAVAGGREFSAFGFLI